MWGAADSGKLGLGEQVLGGAVTVPHVVSLPAAVSKLALGQSHVLALTARGLLYSWGAGFYGRLGLGSTANVYTPARVNFPTPVKPTSTHPPEPSPHTSKSAAAAAAAAAADYDDYAAADYADSGDAAAADYDSVMMMVPFKVPSKASKIPKVRCPRVSRCGKLLRGPPCLCVSLLLETSGCGAAAAAFAAANTFCLRSFLCKLRAPRGPPGSPPSLHAETTASPSPKTAANGELYAWGCTGSGRLGVGWRRKQLQQTPAMVIPNWADPSVSSAAAAAAAAAEDTGFQYPADLQDAAAAADRIHLDPTLSEAAVQSFLSRLGFAAASSSSSSSSSMVGSLWPALQQLLQQEEFETRPDFLLSLEDSLVSILNRDINELLQLGDREKELKQLETHYQTLLIGVAARARCALANTADNKTPEELQSKLPAVEPLAFILQQQPAYLLRLLFSVNLKTEREVVLRVTEQVYMELDDRRIGGLFCCLMRAVARQEVAEVPDLMSCMDPGTSNLMELLRMYALRGFRALFCNALLDLRNPNSFATRASRLGNVDVYYNIDELLPKHGLEKIEDASKSQQEAIRSEFHLGFEALQELLLSGLVGLLQQQLLLLPVAVQRLLLQTSLFVYARGFALDPELLQLGIDFCYTIPVVKLVLNGLFEPLLADPDEFCSA
ncbi:Regulator of chromosome condensation family protein, related, partial [Eimeria tenella]